MDLSEEKKIVNEAKNNPEVFGRLYDEYYRPIFNYTLRRTADVESAKDLTSQTFFKALKGLSKYKWQNVPFSAWLFRIATNEVNDFYRDKKGLVRVDFANIPEIASPGRPDEDFKTAEKELEDKKEYMKIRQCVSKLGPIYQDVLVLRFFEKKKISEISQILGKSEGTIKARLYRGLDELKELIGK